MQRFATWCAIVAVGIFSVVPPEHVHLVADAGHGHDHLLVHRHLQVHHVVHHDHDQPRVPSLDDDDPALTLDSPSVLPSGARSIRPLGGAVRVLLSPPAAVLAAGSTPYRERLIHGPPRASAALRAPPLTSRL